MSNKSGISDQVISLPKGGGALHGIGEKFSPDLHTGTGNFTVPISLPSGRNGFQPQLNLVYSTGNGNGPFGLGWSLSIPGISRKTSKGIPVYDDSEDTFILSGSEDLIPVSGMLTDTIQYHPRTEGLFARIYHHLGSDRNYWEVRSKDGLVSFYGTTPEAAGIDTAIVADPDPLKRGKIFAWKLVQTQDTFGNGIQYEYERDLGEDGPHNWDQIYLKQINYVDYIENGETKFLISIAFEYEDRPDPFSENRSGFEIRTRKRCTHVQISTHADNEQLIRTYNLVYLDQISGREKDIPLNGVSLLSQIEVIGSDGNLIEKLAPLDLSFTQFEPEKRKFFPLQGTNLPAQSLASPNLELAVLFGNGLPDIFEMDGTVRYWRNLGNGKFDLPQNMQQAPSGLKLSDPGVQLIDANGDGKIDLMVTSEGLAGYYSLLFDGLWDRGSFQRYNVAPSFDLKDPEVKLVDMDGDGVTDAIRSGTRLQYFFNDPKEGWKGTLQVECQSIEICPKLDFSDQHVKWADMTGDGLQDVLTVFDGDVEYWPNMGRGKWGKRIHMKNSPRLPFGYNPKRILLGDVDGDGLADLVYVDDTRVTLWINQSGNSWSDPIVVNGTPPVSDMDAVRLADLLGAGISGILWSTDLGTSSRQNYLFLDFTGGIKPYLLSDMDNHIGSVTHVEYAPSTLFYLADNKDLKTRWRTTLPFPVQVVAKVETRDAFSEGKLTTEYSYHHGYWDGAEREFRGFGRVDQRDTEIIEDIHFSPPTETRTWFHQGPVGDEFGNWDELDLSSEFWPIDSQMLSRPQPMVDFLKSLPRRVRRDAIRTLQGRILRTELYALDGDKDLQTRPYAVTEHLNGVCEVVTDNGQTKLTCTPPTGTPVGTGDGSQLRIFFPHDLAERTTQWERGNEPMTKLKSTWDYDSYGQPSSLANIAVPRGRNPRSAANAGDPYLATYTLTDHAQRDDDKRYIVDRSCRITNYEIINDGEIPGNPRPSVFTLLQSIQDGSAKKEVIGQSLNFYDGIAFQGLAFSQIGDHGAIVRTENLVLTESILQEAYKSDNALQEPPYMNPNGAPAWTPEYPQEFRSLIPTLAGYFYRPGGIGSEYETGYFAATERCRYDFQDIGGIGKGLKVAKRDPLGHDTSISYDSFGALPEKVTDPVGLTTKAINDYRVMLPQEVLDPNGNSTSYTFTPLGLLQNTSVKGKNGEGDQQRPSVIMEYDFLAFVNSKQPIFVRTISYEHHDSETDVPQPDRDLTIETVEYSDGFGRLLQTRTQAEDVICGDLIFGDHVLPAGQSVPTGDAVGSTVTDPSKPRVVVSGWQIYDNKGRVVEKYEPFFSEGWDYAQPVEAQLGQKAIMSYDPRGQVIKTVNPDKSEQRVIYGVPSDLTNPDRFTPTPWEAYTYDANDNAGRTHPSDPNVQSYDHHWNTPSNIVIDPLGRTIETVQRNREKLQDGSISPIQEISTKSTYDIRGNLIDVVDALSRLAFHHVYDLANRSLRIENIDAGIRRTILDANGKAVEQRDSKGAVILHAYDLLNRPIRLWARDDSENTVTLRERLEYGDGSDPSQPISDRDANRVDNRLGRLYKHYDEAGLLTFEKYDFKGNVLEKIRQVISDAKILSVFNPPPQNWQISPFRVDWDPGGIPLSDYAKAMLDGTGYQTSTTFDALSRMKAISYPKDVSGERKVLRPHFNRAGALERIELDDKMYVERITYNAKGQRTLIAYGNGVMTRYAYDTQTFRLVHLCSERYTNPDVFTYHPTNSLQDFAYEYDLVGNMLALHDRTPGSGVPNSPDKLDRTFTYDPLYRLLSATGRECEVSLLPPLWDDMPRCNDLTLTRPYNESYQYDPVGNMLQLIHSAASNGFTRDFALVSNGNRLANVTISSGIIGYTYDTNGNLIQENKARQFEWDQSDRMRVYRTQLDSLEPSIHAQYFYDSKGQRVKKLVRKQGQVEVTIYIDRIFEYHKRVNRNAVEEKNILHVQDNLKRIAVIHLGEGFDMSGNQRIQYHFADHMNSSNIVVDDTSTLINREEYVPYGETSFGSFAKKRYRYMDKERDEESGLYYNGARYFGPWIVRWLSADPNGIAEGVNVYAYVRQNPLRFMDPDGRGWKEVFITLMGLMAKDPGTRQSDPTEVKIKTETPENSSTTHSGNGPSPPPSGGGPEPPKRQPSQPRDPNQNWQVEEKRGQSEKPPRDISKPSQIEERTPREGMTRGYPTRGNRGFTRIDPEILRVTSGIALASFLIPKLYYFIAAGSGWDLELREKASDVFHMPKEERIKVEQIWREKDYQKSLEHFAAAQGKSVKEIANEFKENAMKGPAYPVIKPASDGIRHIPDFF